MLVKCNCLSGKILWLLVKYDCPRGKKASRYKKKNQKPKEKETKGQTVIYTILHNIKY